VLNFEDEIVEQLLDSGAASDDLLNDYPNGDAWHHENHVDRWYNFREAVEVIEQLEDFEETDEGLWAGLPMKEALGACAAYTYGNAVYSEWRDLIAEINREADDILVDYQDRIDDAEERVAEDSDGAAQDVEILATEREEALHKLICQLAS